MAKVRRIGANRRKALAEQRKKRPRRVKKSGTVGVIAALSLAVLFALYKYAPALGGHIAQAFKSVNEYPAGFQIVSGSPQSRFLLQRAIDSLVNSGSVSLKKSAVLEAAAAIPEIEKVSVKNGQDKKAELKIIERTPVALVLDGNIKLVDKNGVRFNALSGQYYDLPLIIFGVTDLSDTVKLEKFNIIKKAALHLGDDFFGQISQIDFDGSSSVNLIFKSGRTEYCVGSEDIEERLAHVKKLREKLTRENREIVRADLRYRGLAYLSML